MHLLMLSPHLPSPTWGAGARSYHLLKGLAKRYTVSLLAIDDHAEARSLNQLSLLEQFTGSVQVVSSSATRSKRLQQLMHVASNKSYFLNLFTMTEMQDILNERLARDRVDAIFLESVLMAGYRFPEGIRIIIDQHNIEHELLQRAYELEKPSLRKWYSKVEGDRLKKGELERCQRANLVLVTSERERKILQGLLPGVLIEVVSNGVDTEMFYDADQAQQIPGQIIFTGTMDYYPNTNAVLSFAQQCWPLIQKQVPGVTWKIVGRNPPPEVHVLGRIPGITVTGTVSDVRPYLASSAVAIAPLQIGSGTRLKILEAFAMKKAVVSSSIGCEGLSVIPGKHLLVADNAEEFAQAVVNLLQNDDMRSALGKAGRALVEAEYSWEHSSTQLLQGLEMLLKEEEQVC